MINVGEISNIVTSNLTTFIAVAGVVERVTEFVKQGVTSQIKNDEMSTVGKEALSLSVGCAVCIAGGINLYDGLQVAPLVNQVFAGVIVSLGSNFLHQALSLVLAFKSSAENKNK